MSRAQLARAAGIHPVMPRRYEEPECGEFARPTANTLAALNRALGLEKPLVHSENSEIRADSLLLCNATMEDIVAELHSRNVIPNFLFPQPSSGSVPDAGAYRMSSPPNLVPRSGLSNAQLEKAIDSINEIGRAHFRGMAVTADDLFAHPEIAKLNLSRDEFEDAMYVISTGGGGRRYSIPGSAPLRMNGKIIFGVTSSSSAPG